MMVAYPDSTPRSGLVLDVKWSLPNNHQGLVNELLDLRKYAGPLNGWPMPPSVLEDPDLAILCHLDDAPKVRQALTDLYRDEPEAYAYLVEPGYSVWAWGEVKTRDGHEVIRVSKVWGSLKNPTLESVMGDNVDILKERFLVESTWVKFVGDEPPLAYVMLVILQTVRSYIFGYSPDRHCLVSMDKLFGTFQALFRPVGPGSGPQISRSSLRAGLEALATIGYNAQRLDEEEIHELHLEPPRDWYRFTRKSPRHDLYEWICGRMSQLESRRQARERVIARKARLKVPRKRRVKITRTQRKLPGYND